MGQRMLHGARGRAGRMSARARAAAHAGQAGGGAPWAGLDGLNSPPACTAVKYAGLEPGAHQLSCKPAALRAQARSPPPHWSRKLRLSEKCQTLSAHGQWSVSLCTARAGHEARAMRGQPGCRMPTFDRAAAILTSRLQRGQHVFCPRLSLARARRAPGPNDAPPRLEAESRGGS